MFSRSLKVREGAIVDEAHWLMRPPEACDWFDGFNIGIHGITAEMVENQPRFKEMLPRIMDFIGDDLFVAHNASFDTSVIRYACDADESPWPSLRFLCTLVLSRRVLSLPSYRLPFVLEACGIDSFENHHDALADARAVVDIIRHLADLRGTRDLEELASGLSVRVGHQLPGEYAGSRHRGGGGVGGAGPELPEVNTSADPDGYLYGRVVVFTGKLQSLTRQQAWDALAHAGGEPDKSTTKRTNVLVIGDLDPCHLRPGEELSGKARKAFDLQAKGQDIEVMTEDDFLRCIEVEALTHPDPRLTK